MARVLLIEDTESLREETAEILRFEGFDVVVAEHGGIGLARAREQVPDLVVCDLMMPEVDGYETLTAFRADPQLATVPFVCLTARSERPAMRRAMELGADDFLTKPFAAAELLAAVEAGLAKRARAVSDVEDRLADLRSRITLSLPHEVRTPLTAILGYTELMQDPETVRQPDEVSAMADRIRLAALRLTRLTENFLLLAQIELMANEPDAERHLSLTGRTDVPPLVRHSIATHAGDRRGDVTIETEAVHVGLREDCFAKIVDELLDNAIKFSVPGSPIGVSVRAVDERTAALVVSDHGRGMTPEEVGRVGAYMQFERRVYEQQGLGVGLVIARRLAELCGGGLELASATGEGTTVTVRLPLVTATATGRDAPAPRASAGRVG